jgi:hypothetical protein
MHESLFRACRLQPITLRYGVDALDALSESRFRGHMHRKTIVVLLKSDCDRVLCLLKILMYKTRKLNMAPLVNSPY